MLNKDFRIAPLDGSRCNIGWIAPWDSAASWLFINGRHVLGPVLTGSAERLIPVPWPAETIVALEVHDFPNTAVVPKAIEIAPNIQPTIQWRGVEQTVRYRLYHRAFGEAAETLLLELPARDGIEEYQITSPATLAAGWHFFHVEAVDVYGNQSTRQAWNYFVFDLPASMPALTIAAGNAAGLYTFTLED